LWLRQIDHFQATHFVIAPDLPGLTGSAAKTLVDFVEIAKDLERALKEQGINRLSICGISAGSSIALALALRMNMGIQHLILSAAQARAPRIALSLQIVVCQATPKRLLLSAAARICKNDPDILCAAIEDCNALGKQGFLNAMRALQRLDLRGGLSTVIAPTWLLCGSRDWVNIPAARTIATTIPGAKLIIEPGAGHLWNVERPARFNEILTLILAAPNHKNYKSDQTCN
jgi:3-oxoadipate enol-lactonase